MNAERAELARQHRNRMAQARRRGWDFFYRDGDCRRFHSWPIKGQKDTGAGYLYLYEHGLWEQIDICSGGAVVATNRYDRTKPIPSAKVEVLRRHGPYTIKSVPDGEREEELYKRLQAAGAVAVRPDDAAIDQEKKIFRWREPIWFPDILIRLHQVLEVGDIVAVGFVYHGFRLLRITGIKNRHWRGDPLKSWGVIYSFEEVPA